MHHLAQDLTHHFPRPTTPHPIPGADIITGTPTCSLPLSSLVPAGSPPASIVLAPPPYDPRIAPYDPRKAPAKHPQSPLQPPYNPRTTPENPEISQILNKTKPNIHGRTVYILRLYFNPGQRIYPGCPCLLYVIGGFICGCGCGSWSGGRSMGGWNGIGIDRRRNRNRNWCCEGKGREGMEA